MKIEPIGIYHSLLVIFWHFRRCLLLPSSG